MPQLPITAGAGVAKRPASASAALPRSYLDDLELSNGADADHDINIAVGECRDNDAGAVLSLTSVLTKQIDAAWAVGTNQGGLDTGTVTTSTWYAVWLIKRSDTDVVDALFSTSFSSPTMPTDYDQKRRIGAVLTDGSSNIVAFTQIGDDVWWDIPASDVSAGTWPTSRTALTLTAPPNSIAHTHTETMTNNSTSLYGLILPTGLTDTVPSASAFTHRANVNLEVGGLRYATQHSVNVDSSSQVNIRGTSAAPYSLITSGYTDRRGRDG